MYTYIGNIYIYIYVTREKKWGTKSVQQRQLDILGICSVRFRHLNPETQLTKPLLNLPSIQKIKDTWDFTKKFPGVVYLAPDPAQKWQKAASLCWYPLQYKKELRLLLALGTVLSFTLMLTNLRHQPHWATRLYSTFCSSSLAPKSYVFVKKIEIVHPQMVDLGT